MQKAILSFVCLGLVRALTAGEVSGIRHFAVDATKPGKALPNPSQTLVSWRLPAETASCRPTHPEWNVLDFAEYVEVMAATGGNPERDCYRRHDDKSVLDDYDFDRLVRSCRHIRGMGLRPYLKLGNVPRKLSTKVGGGNYTINTSPPDDFAAYGRYMEACAKALLAAFGHEDVLKWRFAVLTEYENDGWFKDPSGDPEKSFRAYCRLYETTALAFVKVLSPDVDIGIHAMAVTEGQWDERRFFAFAAEKRLPLKFATVSFYDTKPGVPTGGLSLPRDLAHIRAAAEKAGFANLRYAVDEGRLLCGVAGGSGSSELALRVVGDTYQAAFDARVVKQLFDAGADYFAAWGYFSGPHTWFEGLPSVSFHVAREAARFKGLLRLGVTAEGAPKPGIESEAVAAVSPDGQMLRVMAYAFTNDLRATGLVPVRMTVKLPTSWAGKTAAVRRCRVDDDANWYDEWRAERARRGIGDNRFSWSPDDPATCDRRGLQSPEDLRLFRKELEPVFCDKARLWWTDEHRQVGSDGVLELRDELPVNAVLFWEMGETAK